MLAFRGPRIKMELANSPLGAPAHRGDERPAPDAAQPRACSGAPRLKPMRSAADHPKAAAQDWAGAIGMVVRSGRLVAEADRCHPT
jgi:hypothetical protein